MHVTTANKKAAVILKKKSKGGYMGVLIRRKAEKEIM